MPRDDDISARLRARIYNAFPVEQSAFTRLLQLLDVEATTEVPTAAVTLGDRSRLSINPDFVRRMCSSDYELVMLVLHELHHVALGHTRLFPRVTRAQNWAFDCVINAQLCRLYPGPEWTALFRRSYRADAFPEALLRPPEGWGTDDVRWRPGREGEVHQALYTDHSVSYTDLYELLQELASGKALAVDGLLGNHEEWDGDAWPPDLLREVRNILAEWPMIRRLSGRDQGGEVKRDSVRRVGARRDTVLRLRQALLWAAEAGAGAAPPAASEFRLSPGVLPYSQRLSRTDFLRSALGNPALLHATEVTMREPSRGPRTHVYLDVSGSMEEHLPLVYAALRPLSAHVHPDVHLFSTCIADIDLPGLRRGARVGTGGTCVAPVTAHMLDKGVKRALFVTDGWVGSVPKEHARKLASRGTRVAVAVTHGGDADFARRLSSRIWRLPPLESHS